MAEFLSGHARLATLLARLVLLYWFGSMALPATGEELRGQLERLASQHAFAIDGLDHIGTEDAPEPVSGDLPSKLRDLLHNYNHMMIAGSGKAVERVVVLGQKRGSPGAAPDPSVALTRDGAHHRVEAMVTGPNGRRTPLSLIIDTGASNIVLPESMIPTLGFRDQDLKVSESQTASGSLPVRMGVLKSVALGEHEADDVGVTFVADRKLGSLHLLGMSYLGRYRFTIDDQKGELILMAR
jgi:aspartyl protease family protein